MDSKIGNAEATPLEGFSRELQSLKTAKEKEIEVLLREVNGRFKFNGSFFQRKGKPKASRDTGDFSFESMETGRTVIDSSISRWTLNHVIGVLVSEAITSRPGVSIGKMPVLIKFEYDEATDSAEVTMKSKKVKFWNTVYKSWKEGRIEPVYEKKVKNFKVEGVLQKIYSRSEFHEGRKEAILSAFNPDFDVVLSQVERFRRSVVELSYLSKLADYFLEGEKRGIKSIMPEVAPTETSVLELRNARDPYLMLRIPDTEKVVPNDVSIRADKNVFVITGANGNGKSVYHDMAANVQATTQAGWRVFADTAVVSPRDNIITFAVRPGDIKAGESRHQRELNMLTEVFETVTPNSTVIIDELGTGTNPSEGVVIAAGALRQLHRTGAIALFSTHFPELSETAKELKRADNLHCVVNGEGSRHFTFKIIPGSSSSSEGLALARRSGADESGLAGILERRARAGSIVLKA